MRKNSNPVPGGNDRKFEKWTLRCPTGKGYMTKDKTVEVFTHPSGGHRGKSGVSFRVSYDGVGFEDTDIVRLRERLEEFHMGLDESDYEKVLVVETTGYTSIQDWKKGDEFGISWQIGWRVKRLGFVFDEKRKRKLIQAHISKFDQEDHFNPGKKKDKDNVVVVWTEAREAALQAAADFLGRARKQVDKAFEDEEAFALMLDTQGMKLLEAPKEGEK